MLEKIRSHPCITSLVIFGLYVAWFFALLLFVDIDPNRHGLSGVVEDIGQWKNQVLLTIILTIVLSLLGWWRKIALTTPLNRGGLKFLIVPIIYILTMLFIVVFSTPGVSWLLASTSPQQMLALVLVTMGIGFTEEAMFRGILFYGLSTRFTVLIAGALSSLLFGTLHYVNMLLGAAFIDTTFQVIHAAMAGFMYLALRLRIGAIWPVMLFHCLWDFCLFNMGALNAAAEGESTASPLVTGAFSVVPALLYGSFVYWRWSVYRNRDEQDRNLQPAPGTL